MEHFVLRLERGGPWDWDRDMREQEGWDEHARFMDDLVDLRLRSSSAARSKTAARRCTSSRRTSEEAVRERLATDPWAAIGMLRPVSIERWTIVLDGRG